MQSQIESNEQPCERVAEVSACFASCAGVVDGGIQFVFDFVDLHSGTKFCGVHAWWHDGEWELIEVPYVRDPGQDLLREPLLSAFKGSRQTVRLSSQYQLALETELDAWRRNLFLLCITQARFDDGFADYSKRRMVGETEFEETIDLSDRKEDHS
jgi:hypothetical protein